MDPLEVPLISKYEWEYKNDINQRMRVPDKLSGGASLSEPVLNAAKQRDVQFPDSSKLRLPGRIYR